MKNVHANVSEDGRALIQWREDDVPIPYTLTESGKRYPVTDLDAACLWEPGAPEPFPLLVDFEENGFPVMRGGIRVELDPLMKRPVFGLLELGGDNPRGHTTTKVDT